MMEFFRLGALSQWRQLGSSERLFFAAPQPRNIKLTFLCAGQTDVFAEELGHGAMLVASSRGLFTTEFSVRGDSEVSVDSDASDLVFVLRYDWTQIIEKRDLPVLTNVAPMRQRSSDLERMMYAMSLGERERQRQFDRMLRRLEKAGGAPTGTRGHARYVPDREDRDDDLHGGAERPAGGDVDPKAVEQPKVKDRRPAGADEAE